ncbi:hypothetical protein BCCGELA001_28605 [Bradyrhizobium sp. CCGE-LA001]|nr:hypothetical protein BCCGELA001_28605 [Bradyrhizobium sp. CCGE-LA001]
MIDMAPVFERETSPDKTCRPIRSWLTYIDSAIKEFRQLGTSLVEELDLWILSQRRCVMRKIIASELKTTDSKSVLVVQIS